MHGWTIIFITTIIFLPPWCLFVWRLFRITDGSGGTEEAAAEGTREEPEYRNKWEKYAALARKDADAVGGAEPDDIQIEKEFGREPAGAATPPSVDFDRYAEHLRRGNMLQSANDRIASAREWQNGYDGGLGL